MKVAPHGTILPCSACAPFNHIWWCRVRKLRGLRFSFLVWHRRWWFSLQPWQSLFWTAEGACSCELFRHTFICHVLRRFLESRLSWDHSVRQTVFQIKDVLSLHLVPRPLPWQTLWGCWGSILCVWWLVPWLDSTTSAGMSSNKSHGWCCMTLAMQHCLSFFRLPLFQVRPVLAGLCLLVYTLFKFLDTLVVLNVLCRCLLSKQCMKVCKVSSLVHTWLRLGQVVTGV